MPSPAPEASSALHPRSWRAIALGVMLLVAGLRWGLLATFGSDVPYWDEWAADAARLFKPWLRGELTWSALFALHNEHRIVFTRLWELVFFNLNAHRWDPLLVQTANVVLAAATAGLLVAHAGFFKSPRQRGWILLGGLTTLVVPFGYSNLLIAFQSQFLFFLPLAIGAIGLWSVPRITAARVVAGVSCATLALFTVGAGISVAATLVLVAAWRARHEPEQRRLWLAAALGMSAVVVAGGGLSAPVAPPPTASAALAAAGRHLAWPAGNFITVVTDWPDSAHYLPGAAGTWPSATAPWLPAVAAFLQQNPLFEGSLYWVLGLALHGPVLCLLVSVVQGGRRDTWFVAGLALWVLLNIAAMAVARSEYLIVPPRYQDILAVGLLANALAWFELFPPRPGKTSAGKTRALRFLAAGWLTLALGCLSLTAYGIFCVQLPRKRAENQAAARLIQQYLVSGDARIFVGQPPNHVPWPTQEQQLTKLLRDDEVRRFLPRGILPPERRPPPPLASRIAGVIRQSGWFVALAGLLAIGAGARDILLARRSREEPGI